MSFYSLTKKQREERVAQIKAGIQKNLKTLSIYFTDEDTYIRKAAYLHQKTF